MSDTPSQSSAPQERGLAITTAQATVAAAALAVVSAIGGAFIQSMTTRDVEAGKSSTALSIEKTKVDGSLEIERQKQAAATELARREFETKLILKAIETPDRDEAVRNLKFFLNAGFIQDPDQKIVNLSASQYPSITPPPPTVSVPFERRPAGQPPTSQDQVNPKLFEAASSLVGYSTANVPGTGRGMLASAWSVNEVARIALGKPISSSNGDNGLSILATFEILKARHIEQPIAKVKPGMIIVSPTQGSATGHIGITGTPLADEPDNFIIFSNSSTSAAFAQNFTLRSWKALFEEKKLEVHFFEIDFKAQ
ncbi:hypothetical protein A5906_16110 [Bradyrhizobium sacchari]|uniref:Uncharacterized protein n=1 Tax=Bradyrhizobium sacchari TaxID=1399419 RepID=A0A560K512_9BRAD|nr:hypothetical protein [Bradyrhizobium sacchari]OPY93845.1 hypothetical protein A5906_16110 [Bradyrhizobium sacchari]TWB53975.1 hypothetical protein FBZ94_108261 [Bradyrhizobium sacchari]TWB78423.1 hypothetical protein FBZ95_103261 [Bradyrhizobium sacchari]